MHSRPARGISLSLFWLKPIAAPESNSNGRRLGGRKTEPMQWFKYHDHGADGAAA
jgi:hypothetical protein